MVKILLVAFEFPPLGSGGVQRSMKFAQYLPEFGITPVVVTTDDDSLRKMFPFMAQDPGLLAELRQDLVVERIPCARPSSLPWRRPARWPGTWLSLVEPHGSLWKSRLAQALPALVARHQPRLIFVTLPPFAMAPLWCGIARQFRLPLVIDFRDAWSHWCVHPYRTWLHYYLTLRLERRSLITAARVICTSAQIRTDLLSAHPYVQADKIAIITNGHEAISADWTIEARHNTNAGPFVIGYVGAFYYLPELRTMMMAPWWKKWPH